MKKVILFGVLSLVLLSISGCMWTHFGVADSSTPISGEKKYEIVGHAEGKLAVVHIFGFIPVNFSPDMDSVLKEMVADKNGDAIINIRMYDRWDYYIFATRTATYIEGDVIKYVK